MNDELDDLLRGAFARTDAPEGFASRVMRQTGHKRHLSWRSWSAIAASVALLAAGWSELRQQEVNQHERQLVFALQLTSEKIEAIDQRMRRSAVQLRVKQENFERR